jgi:cyanophycinase
MQAGDDTAASTTRPDGPERAETAGATPVAAMPARRGPVLAIGGAEDKVNQKLILSRFVALAGGADARIAILPTASSIDGAGGYYAGIFEGLGARAAGIVRVRDRRAANGDEAVAQIGAATGIYITGGNQTRLSAVLGGTRLATAIRERNAAGAVVAGTSAGASIISSHMVAFGRSGTTPRQRMAQMSAGFGLVHGVIIDQHFRERDRIGRLLTLVALNPGLLGLGVDEDTAALIDADDVLEVVGRGTVMIIDGAHMHSNVAHARAHTPLSVTDVVLHALGHGYRYDLTARRPLPAPPIRLSKRDQRRLARAGLRLEQADAADDGAASDVASARP